MKKILVLLALMVSFAISAQRSISDTIQGSETVIFEDMQGASQIQVNCVELGGTSDGTLVLKGSVDGVTYTQLASKTGIIAMFPNDTLAISSGATWLVYVSDEVFNYYAVSAVGTASDTTLINIKWSK